MFVQLFTHFLYVFTDLSDQFFTGICNNWHSQRLLIRSFSYFPRNFADVAHAPLSHTRTDSINLIVFSSECLTILANQEHYAIWINILVSIEKMTAYVRKSNKKRAS